MWRTLGQFAASLGTVLDPGDWKTVWLRSRGLW
jgi:hypothetical protein